MVTVASVGAGKSKVANFVVEIGSGFTVVQMKNV
jgi:hypothetical protein